MSDGVYRDMAGMAGEKIEDAWEAMAESYATLGFILCAVLQHTGPIELPKEWSEYAEGFVATMLPQGDGTLRCEAIRRGEVPSDSADGAQAMRERRDRQYRRRV